MKTGKSMLYVLFGAGLLTGGYFLIRNLTKQDDEHSPNGKKNGNGKGKPDPDETTSTSPKQGRKPNFPLSIGSWGKKVVRLQHALNKNYGHHLVVDGKFGDATADALSKDSPIEWCRLNVFNPCNVSESNYNKIIDGVDFSGIQAQIEEWDSANGNRTQNGIWKTGASASQPYSASVGFGGEDEDEPEVLSQTRGSWTSASGNCGCGEGFACGSCSESGDLCCTNAGCPEGQTCGGKSSAGRVRGRTKERSARFVGAGGGTGNCGKHKELVCYYGCCGDDCCPKPEKVATSKGKEYSTKEDAPLNFSGYPYKTSGWGDITMAEVVTDSGWES